MIGQTSAKQTSVSRQQITLVVAVIVVALLFIFTSKPEPLVTGNRQAQASSQSAASRPPDPYQNPAKAKEHIQELAEKYGANFEKLSEDDKTFLNAIAMGHGKELLRMTAQEVKEAETEHSSGH